MQRETTGANRKTARAKGSTTSSGRTIEHTEAEATSQSSLELGFDKHGRLALEIDPVALARLRKAFDGSGSVSYPCVQINPRPCMEPERPERPEGPKRPGH